MNNSRIPNSHFTVPLMLLYFCLEKIEPVDGRVKFDELLAALRNCQNSVSTIEEGRDQQVTSYLRQRTQLIRPHGQGS